MSRNALSRIPWRSCANVLSRAKGDNFSSSKLGKYALRATFHSQFTESKSTRFLSANTPTIRSRTSKVDHGGNCISDPYSTQSIPNLTEGKAPSYIDTKDNDTLAVMCTHMTLIEDFITVEEEQEILREIEPYLKRLKYQSSHWDDAIHEYRETERKKWTERNMAIFQRVRDAAFPPGTPQLAYVHVLDLKKEGQIKAHVDAVKFCGNTIAGISLLSTAVMRLVHTEDKTKSADILLKQRSLYIMKDDARYHYTHEVLAEAESYFRGIPVPRDRRISVICRNEPET